MCAGGRLNHRFRTKEPQRTTGVQLLAQDICKSHTTCLRALSKLSLHSDKLVRIRGARFSASPALRARPTPAAPPALRRVLARSGVTGHSRPGPAPRAGAAPGGGGSAREIPTARRGGRGKRRGGAAGAGAGAPAGPAQALEGSGGFSPVPPLLAAPRRWRAGGCRGGKGAR